jgi:hypothetical protein
VVTYLLPLACFEAVVADCQNPFPHNAMKKEPEPFQLDLADLMEVICQYRRERFSFERHVAAMTFCAWLHYPLRPAVAEYGRLLAGANVIRALKHGFLKLSPITRRKQIASIFGAVITPDAISRLLLQSPVGGFENWTEFNSQEVSDASGISNFLVQCPSELKPSLNKAFFFIDEGGYPGTVSVSTTKKVWAKFAPAASFASAAYFFRLERLEQGHSIFSSNIDLFHLPPDGVKSVEDAATLLDRTDDLRDYFSVCRFIQERLLAIIGKKAGSQIALVTFPNSIKPKPIPIHPLEPRQIEIVRRYRAPKII